MKLSLTLDWREWSAPEKIQNDVVPAGHCPPIPPPPCHDYISYYIRRNGSNFRDHTFT